MSTKSSFVSGLDGGFAIRLGNILNGSQASGSEPGIERFDACALEILGIACNEGMGGANMTYSASIRLAVPDYCGSLARLAFHHSFFWLPTLSESAAYADESRVSLTCIRLEA